MEETSPNCCGDMAAVFTRSEVNRRTPLPATAVEGRSSEPMVLQIDSRARASLALRSHQLLNVVSACIWTGSCAAPHSLVLYLEMRPEPDHLSAQPCAC